MNSINWQGICYINGCLLFALAIAMLFPAFGDVLFFKEDKAFGFYIGFFVCFVIGGALVLGNATKQKMVLGQREAFLITTLVWVVLSFFSSLPFYLIIQDISFIDSFFESVSALTTTGETIIKKVEMMPRSILLWRALLQWLGGIGIIVIAMSFFPALRIGGMQLFRSEFSDRYEKILPKISQISLSLLFCYSLFTACCALLYYFAGMSGFDAFCHSMGTISTGGLSNYSDSLKHFESPTIEFISSVFMIVGGMTLMLFIRMFYDNWKVVFKDSQFKLFMMLLGFFSSLVALWLCFFENYSFFNAIRFGVFNVISCFTTTGYSNTNLSWHPFCHVIFFFLGCVGGCTGSTTGGIKIFRLQVLFTIAKNHMRQLRRPQAVLIPKFQGQKITDPVAFSVFTLVSLYMLMLVMLTVLLSMSGISFQTAFSSAGSVLGNVGTDLDVILKGQGEGDVIGTFSKLTLIFGMICGRLELLTVLILFMPSFWKD